MGARRYELGARPGLSAVARLGIEPIDTGTDRASIVRLADGRGFTQQPSGQWIEADPTDTFTAVRFANYGLRQHTAERAASATIAADAHNDATARNERDAHIDATARIERDAHIGARARIGANAHVGRHARIGDDTIIGPGAFVGVAAVVQPGAIIQDHAVAGAHSYVADGTVIAPTAALDATARTNRQQRIGPPGRRDAPVRSSGRTRHTAAAALADVLSLDRD